MIKCSYKQISICRSEMESFMLLSGLSFLGRGVTIKVSDNIFCSIISNTCDLRAYKVVSSSHGKQKLWKLYATHWAIFSAPYSICKLILELIKILSCKCYHQEIFIHKNWMLDSRHSIIKLNSDDR